MNQLKKEISMKKSTEELLKLLDDADAKLKGVLEE